MNIISYENDCICILINRQPTWRCAVPVLGQMAANTWRYELTLDRLIMVPGTLGLQLRRMQPPVVTFTAQDAEAYYARAPQITDRMPHRIGRVVSPLVQSSDSTSGGTAVTTLSDRLPQVRERLGLSPIEAGVSSSG